MKNISEEIVRRVGDNNGNYLRKIVNIPKESCAVDEMLSQCIWYRINAIIRFEIEEEVYKINKNNIVLEVDEK